MRLVLAMLYEMLSVIVLGLFVYFLALGPFAAFLGWITTGVN